MKPQSLPMVYLVDDEEVVRDALAWLLRSRRLLSEGFGSAEAFESMLDALPRGGRDWPSAPSCLLPRQLHPPRETDRPRARGVRSSTSRSAGRRPE